MSHLPPDDVLRELITLWVEIEKSQERLKGIMDLLIKNAKEIPLKRLPTPEEVHENAVAHGWWETPREVPELLCLVHSEASEALEGYRNHIPEGEKGCLSEELADVVIRVWDMSAAFGIDIVDAIAKKHEINKGRPYRHGGKRC